VFKVDFSFIFRLDCIDDYNWHTKMYFTLAIFACLAASQAVLLFMLEVAASTSRVSLPQIYRKVATFVVLVRVQFPRV
jgi:hypothetical protein